MNSRPPRPPPGLPGRPSDRRPADRSPSGRRPLRAGGLRLTRLRLTPLQWIGGGATALFALVALLTGGPWSAIIMIALIILVTAVYGIALRRPTWLGLPRRRRISAIAGAGALVALLLSTSAYGATSSPAPAPPQIAAVASGAERSAEPAPEATVSAAPTTAPTPTPTPTVVITTETITETAPVARASRTEEDPNAEQGTSAFVTGTDGLLTRTFEVIKHDGVEVSRTQQSEAVTIAAIDDVTRVGTRAPAPAPVAAAPSGCHSSYAGECVPITSDADCAAGSGDGPAYVQGPVTVVGPDEYDLDRDGDGIACDS